MNPLIDNQKAYLLRCQLPSGTFRLAPKSERINPYFTNLAIIALVRLGEIAPVKQHVAWYLKHLNESGYVNDFRLLGEQEVDSGSADSEDSYHATLFSLLAETVRRTEAFDWVAAFHPHLVQMTNALLALQQKDGLTWAKRSYRVKYLMDNCEVWRGLEDVSFLFSLLGDVKMATLTKERAAQCQLGLRAMYSSKLQRYAVSDGTYGDWRKWYPDATSQAFPIVYQLCTDNNPAARHIYQQITTHFPNFDHFQTGDLYPWMVMGECARLMKDTERVSNLLHTAESLYIYGPRQPYWLIHEAGWFIQLSLGLTQAKLLHNA